MISKRKFKAEDLKNLDQFHFGPICIKSLMTEESLKRLESRPEVYSFVDGDKVLACAGFTNFWPGRVECWAVFDKSVKEDFLVLFKKMKFFIDEKLEKVRRIEAVVECGFVEGDRMVELLGFELECPRMKKYGVNGTDHSLWAKVRE